MRRLLPLLLTVGLRAQDWAECSRFAWAARGPWQGPTAVFLNSHTGDGVTGYPSGAWVAVRLPDAVPEDARAVFLDGFLVVTHGAAPELADLTVAFRAVGDRAELNYNLQAIAPTTGSGARTPIFTEVPVRGRWFAMKWRRSTKGDWPQHSSYCLNLSVAGWCR